MKNFIISFLTLIVFIGALGNGFAQQNATCTRHLELTPVHNFATEKILGKWIAVKFLSQLEQDAQPVEYKCLESNIRRSNGTDGYDLIVSETLQNLTDGSRADFDSFITLPFNNTPAIWEVVSGDLETRSDSVYLHTDYKSWALQYLCSVRDNGYRYENILVWKRTREPDERLDEFLDVLLENFGFPLENEIIVDQTNCTSFA